MSKYQPESHAVVPPPGLAEVTALARMENLPAETALGKLLEMRAGVIRAEREDPLRCGWEPGIWKICDALLGLECHDGAFLEELARRQKGDGAAGGRALPRTWEAWAAGIRAALGYAAPVQMLLILGGNRSGKSEYAAKRCIQMMLNKPGARVYAMHMSNPRSVADQQPLFWKYLPPEWRIQTATVDTYIKYKRKTGFSENSFITPNGSECAFLNYMQDRDTALEGLEADLVAPDELIPADWVETLRFRLATRSGKAIITFTPIHGYTPTVKIFLDGARLVKSSRAYLCPRDGGDRMEWAALGLTEEEYKELWEAEKGKRPAAAPQSRADGCVDLAGGPFDAAKRLAQGDFETKSERRFEEAPRVMRCVDPRKAVVYFQPSDNPFGNPKEVAVSLRKKGVAYVRERFYGQAEKTISVLIPKFSKKIHIVKAKDIPMEGTNYQFMDPAENRNFFMAWFRRTREAAYLYREWPGNYPIPGVGVPGPWAFASGRKDGINDGAKGEGQGPWGFGLLRYKFEIARLEGWADYKEWKQTVSGERLAVSRGRGEEYPGEDDLRDWNPGLPGAGELVAERFVDSRAASKPRIEEDRPVTLQTELDDILLYFNLTPGSGIMDGVAKINSALDYEQDDLNNFIQDPHFFICEECENSIYAIENWMNADGETGACKDPIDLIRYFMTAECEYLEDGMYGSRGGMSYGTRSQRWGWGERIRASGRRILPPAVLR